METTVRLDPEVAAEAEHLRRKHNIGLGEASNELARAGSTQKEQPSRLQQRTANIGLKADITNIAEALEMLDEYDASDAEWSSTRMFCFAPMVRQSK
ncbi:MAG: CopG family transcriptional regulator [Propionibacteriaceae bacterium]|nr:CopG family transcriptional regulator [Propionibacteriaceae bacterium]